MPSPADFVRLQQPAFMTSPPPMHNFTPPPIVMPQLPAIAPLHPDFCRLVPTPQHLLPIMAPMTYSTTTPIGQPIGLVGLKNAANDVMNRVWDGTEGVTHILEPFLQKEMLETLGAQIDSYCAPK